MERVPVGPLDLAATAAIALAAAAPAVTAAAAAARDLGHARAGEELRVLAVPAGHAAALAREGVVAGCRLEVETVVPLGGPVIARCGGARVALGRVVANRVLVEALA